MSNKQTHKTGELADISTEKHRKYSVCMCVFVCVCERERELCVCVCVWTHTGGKLSQQCISRGSRNDGDLAITGRYKMCKNFCNNDKPTYWKCWRWYAGRVAVWIQYIKNMNVNLSFVSRKTCLNLFTNSALLRSIRRLWRLSQHAKFVRSLTQKSTNVTRCKCVRIA